MTRSHSPYNHAQGQQPHVSHATTLVSRHPTPQRLEPWRLAGYHMCPVLVAVGACEHHPTASYPSITSQPPARIAATAFAGVHGTPQGHDLGVIEPRRGVKRLTRPSTPPSYRARDHTMDPQPPRTADSVYRGVAGSNDPRPHRWIARTRNRAPPGGEGAVATPAWYAIMFTLPYRRSDRPMRPPSRDMSAHAEVEKREEGQSGLRGPLSRRNDACTRCVHRPGVVHAVEAVRWCPLGRCWRAQAGSTPACGRALATALCGRLTGSEAEG